MLELLVNFSVFSVVAFIVAAVWMLAERDSGRRPNLSQQRSEAELQRYGATITSGGMFQRCLIGGAVIGLVLLVLTHSIVFAIVPFVIGLIRALTYPGRVKKKYFRQFEDDFAECLDIWTRCLQSGLSFQQAIDTASKDLSGPASNEMSILMNDIRLGDVDGALWRLHERMPLADVRYAVLGVITCRQTGGKMSEVMGNISGAIRERQAMRERINAITSMGRTEAYIMAAMPFAIGFMMYLLEPTNISLLLGTVIGVVGTLVAILWESIGLVIIWKIVDIKA